MNSKNVNKLTYTELLFFSLLCWYGLNYVILLISGLFIGSYFTAETWSIYRLAVFLLVFIILSRKENYIYNLFSIYDDSQHRLYSVFGLGLFALFFLVGNL